MTDNDNKDPQIREAFEKWYGSSPERCSKYPAQYLNVFTQARWEAWQAAQQVQVSEEMIERASKAIHHDFTPCEISDEDVIVEIPWEQMDEEYKIITRGMVRAALAAIHGGGEGD